MIELILLIILLGIYFKKDITNEFKIKVLIIVVFIIVLLLLIKKQKDTEHMTTLSNVDYEALQSLSSMYSSGQMTLSSLTVTNGIKTNNLTVSGDLDISGNITATGTAHNFTYGASGAPSQLYLQEDGNFVIYGGGSRATGKACFASNIAYGTSIINSNLDMGGNTILSTGTINAGLFNSGNVSLSSANGLNMGGGILTDVGYVNMTGGATLYSDSTGGYGQAPFFKVGLLGTDNKTDTLYVWGLNNSPNSNHYTNSLSL